MTKSTKKIVNEGVALALAWHPGLPGRGRELLMRVILATALLTL
jgi:hypothetical protein